MPNLTPSLDSRLRALQTVSQFVPGARRSLAFGQGIGPLAALLREVNETMLARNLQFEAGNSSLAMDVAGRRILRVTAFAGISAGAACLTAPVLEDAHKDEFCAVLRQFCAASPDLRVATAPVNAGGGGMSVGLPVSRLADSLAIDLTADAPEPVAQTPPDFPGGFFPRFITQMGGGLMAWLIHRQDDADQTGETQGGPQEMVDHLRGFLDDELAAVMVQLDALTATPGDAVCTVVSADMTQGHSLLCVRSDAALLLGIISGEAAGSVLQAWTAARR